MGNVGELGKYGDFDFHLLGGGRGKKISRFSIAPSKGKDGNLISTYLVLNERKLFIFWAN